MTRSINILHFIESKYAVFLIIIAVTALGIYEVTSSSAQIPYVNAPASQGTLGGSAKDKTNAGTSNGQYVQFGSSSTGSGTTGGTFSVLSNVKCDFRIDTWNGSASSVGYTANDLSASNGNPGSLSVTINADSTNRGVMGYPSLQCLMYSALPTNLASEYNITPPVNSAGLDYEFAYDIWLTTASDAQAANWSNKLELMIWNYVNGQVPAGSVKGSLSDGSKVWVRGTNTSGTVSVVMPSNQKSGTVNISSIISQLQSLGYITTQDNGILDVEYGIEAPYGGNQTFSVNSLSVGLEN